jgi:hypothetical protein
VLRLKAHIAHRSAPLSLEEVTGERPARFLLGLLFEHCRGTQNTFLRLQLQNCGIPGGSLGFDIRFANSRPASSVAKVESASPARLNAARLRRVGAKTEAVSRISGRGLRF